MANCKGSYCLLLIVLAVVGNQLQIPVVTCQEDDTSTRCLPRKTFYAFLRLPEVSSNLAAYSRTARIIQDARNDFVHLKSLTTPGSEDSEDARICLPAIVYYEIFSDPTMRAHLNAIERAQKMVEEPERMDEMAFDSEKRSLATLAKNGDLPPSIQERAQKGKEDEEKRSETSITPEELLKLYVGESSGEKPTEVGYPLPWTSLDSDPEDLFSGKRNVASLARDYALPGRRNIASMAREFGLPSGKRNVGTLARDRQLPSGKRNPSYTLERFFVIPVIAGKRNVGSLARDSALPPYGKRGIASLARNGDFPFPKRNVGTLARDWSLPQSRHGRSLDENEMRSAGVNQRLDASEGSQGSTPFEAQLNDVKARGKRQADYTDEYPLPVMQNTNVLDYEDIMEAIANGFPQTAKRFMGAGASVDDWQDDDDTVPVGYHGPYQPSKRHIGALARLGWLPSFRAARFSRSPRYLVGREDSADGATSDDSSDVSTRSLSAQRRGSGTRYEQSLKGDCRHGFRRYLLIPTNDNYIDKKLRYSIDF